MAQDHSGLGQLATNINSGLAMTIGQGDAMDIVKYTRMLESMQQGGVLTGAPVASATDSIQTVINQINRDARRRQAAKEVLETLMAHANIAVFADVETNTIYKNAIAAAVESVRKSL